MASTESLQEAAPSAAGRKVLRNLGNSMLFFATIAEVLLPFVRNVALARLLSPHQFGLAITFSVVWGILEQVTDIGINFFAVRAPVGVTEERYYATLHGLTVMRSLFLAIFLTVTSPICAWIFSAPEATWAYAILGLVTIIRGFYNVGIREAIRSYEYWREGAVVLISQLLWTVFTLAAAFWLENFYAALLALVGNGICWVALTHIFSKRRWRLGWDKAVVKENLAYGRPLMLNGAANAFTQLADRLFVGATLGVVQLGIYNVTMATAVLPRNAITKFMNTLYMPGFVNLGLEKSREIRLFETWLLNLAIVGFAYGIGLLSIGPIVIETLFGEAFRPTTFVMGLIAILLCAKFLIQLPVPASLAFGQTRFVLYGNVASAVGVFCGIAVLFLTRDFDYFISTLAIGETAALVFIATRGIAAYGELPGLSWTIVLLPVCVLAGLLLLEMSVDFALIPWIALCWVTGLLTIAALVGMSLVAGWRPSALKALRRSEHKKPAQPDIIE